MVLASGVCAAVRVRGVDICKDQRVGLILPCLAQCGHVLGVLAYVSLHILLLCPKLELLK